MQGDIVLPSLSRFFNDSVSSTSPSFFLENINTDLDAAINNSLTLEANAGNNMAQASSSMIQTGTTHSSLSTYNKINSILFGGNSLLLLLRVTGTWLGGLVGTPASLEFTHDGDMHLLQSETRDSSTHTQGERGSLESTSTALLNNLVTVRADSGNNDVSDSNSSLITSGDAYASANIVNIANTHIIGRNWLLAIINIFGDFNGDVAFGRPDLWVGEQVTGDGIITNDSDLLYRITITNKGDNISSNVIVTSAYDSVHLDITESSYAFVEDGNGNLIFSIGDLLPDESHEILFHAKIKNTVPRTLITNTTKAFGDEKDNNIVDNTDIATISTTIQQTTSSGGGYQYPVPAILLVTPIKQNTPPAGKNTLHYITVSRASSSTKMTQGGNPVQQTILIKNPTNMEIPDVIFNDYLLDSTGKTIKTETWDVGTILPFEEITLTYSLSFGQEAQVGTYILSSELLGTHNQNIFFSSNGTVIYTGIVKETKYFSLPTATTTLSYITPQKVHIPKEFNNSSVLKNTFFERAYATDELDAPDNSTSTIPSSLYYIFLFLVFSLMRMFKRWFHKRLYSGGDIV